MTRFLIIDTCVWIGLASEPKLYGLLETLNISLKETDFTLVLPESVKVEFERHRDGIKSSWKNKCKSLINNIHIGGEDKDRIRDRKPDRLCGSEIEDQVELGGLFHR